MADKFARQSGAWTSGSTWDNGQVPITGDRVFANGWTIDINQDIDVQCNCNTSHDFQQYTIGIFCKFIQSRY